LDLKNGSTTSAVPRSGDRLRRPFCQTLKSLRCCHLVRDLGCA
jgi:hypothetical protein